MEYKTVVASIILGVVFIFGFVPTIGSWFGGRFTSYKEDFAMGVAVLAVLSGVGVAVSAIAWSVKVLIL